MFTGEVISVANLLSRVRLKLPSDVTPIGCPVLHFGFPSLSVRFTRIQAMQSWILLALCLIRFFGSKPIYIGPKLQAENTSSIVPSFYRLNEVIRQDDFNQCEVWWSLYTLTFLKSTGSELQIFVRAVVPEHETVNTDSAIPLCWGKLSNCKEESNWSVILLRCSTFESFSAIEL